ncbi:MAG: MaoC/PaaZ C-terminal domain-containing protein [Thermoleophilaceae bacterium]
MSAPLGKAYDDLELGERFVTKGRTVTESDVVMFAALSGDSHPQHTDAEWAAGSRFGERIAHGMLLLSYAVGLMDFDPERVVALRRVADATFKRPVRIGETIRVESELTDKRELDPEHGLVGCRWRILSGSGTLVARAAVEIVWRRDGASAAPAPAAEAPPEPVLL